MLNDLRYAWRNLRKDHAFTLLAVLILSLGLCLATTSFSITNTLLFRPLPYPNQEQLVMVFRTAPQADAWPHSPANFRDLSDATSDIMGCAAWTNHSISLVGNKGPAEFIDAYRVSNNFFSLLKVVPELGRLFTPEDDLPGAPLRIVITHALWQSHFNGDPEILNTTIRADGASATIIGVLPASFDVPLLWGPIQAFTPLCLSSSDWQARGSNYLNLFARLQPGVSQAQASTRLTHLAQLLAQRYPDTNQHQGIRLHALQTARMDTTYRQLSWLITGLSILVLLIACVNLACLHLSKAIARERDFTIRSALGATRLQLMRPLFMESALLSLCGALLGLLLSLWTTELLSKQILINEGRETLPLVIDFRVVGATFVLALLTSLVFGSAPAWVASRSRPADILRQGSRGGTGDRRHHFLRSLFIITEVALCLAILVISLCFTRAYDTFTTRDLHWTPNSLSSGSLMVPQTRYPNAADRVALYRRIISAMEQIPGVSTCSITSELPLWNYPSSGHFNPTDRPPFQKGLTPLCSYLVVSPQAFETLGIKLLSGRGFDENDDFKNPRRLVINKSLALRFWPDQDAVGKHLRFDGDTEDSEIIGIVDDVAFASNTAIQPTPFQAYRPLYRHTWSYLRVVVRGNTSEESLPAAMRKALGGVDPDLALFQCRAVPAQIRLLNANFVLIGHFLLVFTLVGLVFTSVGIFGVTAQSLRQRTRELGIRLALGAMAGDLIWLLMKQTLRLACLGILCGLAGAWFLGHLLQQVLPLLSVNVWQGLALTLPLLIASTLLATWLPARRATRLPPSLALLGD